MRANYAFNISERVALRRTEQALPQIATSANVLCEDGYVVCRYLDVVPSMTLWIGSDEINVSIKLLIASYLFEEGNRWTSRSRKAFSYFLRPFVDCVDFIAEERGASFKNIDDLPNNMPFLYESWLLEPRFYHNKSKYLTDKRRGEIFNTFLNFASWCRNERRCYLTTPWLKKSNPWRSALRRTSSPRPDVIRQEKIDLIRDKCISEISETRDYLIEGQRLIGDMNLAHRDLHSSETFKDERVGAWLVHEMWVDAQIKGGTPYDIHVPLKRALKYGWTNKGKINRYLFITPRQMVPFVVMLAIDTIFNTSTVLGLRWRDIKQKDPVFGSARWTLQAAKLRAKNPQRRSFDAELDGFDHPVGVLQILRDHMQRYRRFAPVELKDDVFLCYSTKDSKFLSLKPTLTGDSVLWSKMLDVFLSEAEIDRFTIRQIRAAGAEAIFRLTGGDLKAEQIALGHASSDSVYQNYLWRSARAFGHETLAQIMARQQRLIASRGKVDDRDGLLIEGGGTAATPGFGCLEPENSPVPGQRIGRMCNAYGFCPTCRNGVVNLKDASSLAKLRLVRNEINQARTRLSPVRWVSEWRHQLAAIEQVWIPAFASDIAAEADTIAPLPVPTIE